MVDKLLNTQPRVMKNNPFFGGGIKLDTTVMRIIMVKFEGFPVNNNRMVWVWFILWPLSKGGRKAGRRTGREFCLFSTRSWWKTTNSISRLGAQVVWNIFIFTKSPRETIQFDEHICSIGLVQPPTRYCWLRHRHVLKWIDDFCWGASRNGGHLRVLKCWMNFPLIHCGDKKTSTHIHIHINN